MEEQEHPIGSLMKTVMENIREMVDVNTVVGDAVETEDGTVIVPVSRVSFGFAAGGSDYNLESEISQPGGVRRNPFAGGSGGGVSVQPVGFLVVGRDHVRLLPVTDRALYDRLIDLAPELIDRLLHVIGLERNIHNNGRANVPVETDLMPEEIID